MHAYLIIGNGALVQATVEKKVKQLKAKQFSFEVKKIADVRELGKFTKLTLNEKTAIVISDFDQLGEEAQNAFLKALEEPQENLTYVLAAQNINNVLPTILSRCEVIEVKGERSEISEDLQDEIQKFLNAEAGERMKTIAKIGKRDEAVEFVNNILIVGRGQVSKENIQVLNGALKTLRALKANGNVQLQLTNFVANLD